LEDSDKKLPPSITDFIKGVLMLLILESSIIFFTLIKSEIAGADSLSEPDVKIIFISSPGLNESSKFTAACFALLNEEPPSSTVDMLNELSIIITALVRAPDENNPEGRRAGLENASTRHAIKSTRTASKSHCLSFIRLILFF
jgi:hypothetical protein